MRREIRPRKVLMVLESCYPTEGGGGAEGQVRTISRYLAERGIPVEIIAPLTREAPRAVHDEVDGVAVWRIPYPKMRFIGGMMMLVRFAAYLVRHRREYDVIHAHIAHNMAAVSCIVGRMLGKTVIVKLTGWLEIKHGVLAPGLNPMMAAKRAALRLAHYIQATSTQIRDRLLARGFREDRVCVIPNAVDIRRFVGAHREVPDASRSLTGVYVGRLVPEKGLDALVAAWTQAYTVNDRVCLMMIGEGGLREELGALIRSLGREHQLKLLGARADVEEFLAAADFGVLPSLYEGLSNTLLEYMAAGLPVLGTRVSGTEDFIENGKCGWLVEAGDVAGMTASLREIARMDRSALAQLGVTARQRVTARAGIDAVVARLAELYDMSAALADARRGECA